jgi:hypothetical protein
VTADAVESRARSSDLKTLPVGRLKPVLNQLIRYEAVAREVEAAPGQTLLEVGSGSRGIAQYVAESWRLTASDVSFSD